MKKFLSLILTVVLTFMLASCSVDTDIEEIENNDTETENMVGIQDEEKLSFELVAGVSGEYGTSVTFNAGTEFEDTFYAYYVPLGIYVVTNKGEYANQINVYSQETHVTEEGWEEPAEVIDVKLIDAEKSDTITIEDGQYIKIVEPAIFEFVME